MTTQPISSVARAWLWLLAAILLAAGLFFVIGGGKLLSLGGSWYFVIAGIVLVLSAIQIFRARPAGAWLYLAAFAGTIIWSLAEVGLDYWGLISRLLAMTFGAAVVTASLPILDRAAGRAARPALPLVGALVLLAAGLAGFGSMFRIHPEVVAAAPAAQPVAVATDALTDWPHYGNGTDNTRFAALDQITPANVDQLKVA